MCTPWRDNVHAATPLVCGHIGLDSISNTVGVLLETGTYHSWTPGFTHVFLWGTCCSSILVFFVVLSLSLSLSVFVWCLCMVNVASVCSILGCPFRFSLTFMVPVSVFIPFVRLLLSIFSNVYLHNHFNPLPLFGLIPMFSRPCSW